MDASKVVYRMQEILEEKRLKSERLTGAKLVDLLVKDTETTDALAKALPFIRLGRMQHTRMSEFLLAWCLCHEVVSLDFHFTPYSTIAYIVSAPSSHPPFSKLQLPLDVLEYKETLKPSRKRPLPPTIDCDSD